MRSGNDKASGANQGAKGGGDLQRSNTRSKRKTAHTEAQRSTRASSTRGDQHTSHKASNSPTVIETYDWVNSDTVLDEYQEDSSTEFYKQQQSLDLLGIALQNSKDSQLDNERLYPTDVLEPIPQEDISACPAHSTLLVGLQGNVNSVSSLSSGMNVKPLERYIAEGLADRYALLQVKEATTEGDWARYSTCSCPR